MEGKGTPRSNESCENQKAVVMNIVCRPSNSNTNISENSNDYNICDKYKGLTCVSSKDDVSDKSDIVLENNIKFVYFNARSIVNKLSELELLVREENVDVLGICETWLLEVISDDEISFSGYSLFRRDRSDLVKERGGGVLLYIKNELNPSLPELCDTSLRRVFGVILSVRVIVSL